MFTKRSAQKLRLRIFSDRTPGIKIFEKFEGIKFPVN